MKCTFYYNVMFDAIPPRLTSTVNPVHFILKVSHDINMNKPINKC